MNARFAATNNWPELAVQAHWSVAALARLCGVSVATLERYFLKKTGERPHDWMTRLRMGQAQTELQNGATVKQAAIKAGYEHSQHFSRDFKKHFGRSPSEFRQRSPL